MNHSQSKISSSVFWGIILVLTAIVLVLDGIGFSIGYGITPLRVVLCVLLLAWLIYEIVKLRFTNLFFPLAFLFLTMEEPIVHAMGKEGILIPAWKVLLAALLLTIGSKCIFRRRSTEISNKQLGSSTIYLDGSDLRDARVSDNLGSVQVYITGPENYNGGGVITVTDNLGIIKLHIPSEWYVVTRAADNLGRCYIPPQKKAREKSITLVVTDNLGTINVEFD